VFCLNPQLFVGGLMSYLRYLCLFAHSGVHHILCCVFISFFVVLCTPCCQCIWIVHFFYCPSVFSNVYLKEAGTTYHSPVPVSTPGFSFLGGSRLALVFVFRIVLFCCLCFIYLYSVSCSQCCLRLWIFDI
jgi:hypothetical protein